MILVFLSLALHGLDFVYKISENKLYLQLLNAKYQNFNNY